MFVFGIAWGFSFACGVCFFTVGIIDKLLSHIKWKK
jgi:hypothetical protein